MALDTKEKRMAAAGVGRPWMRAKLPGANDEEWRVASGNAWGGNALTITVKATDIITQVGPHGTSMAPYVDFTGKVDAGGGAGSIINLIMQSNVGADLYNGTLQ